MAVRLGLDDDFWAQVRPSANGCLEWTGDARNGYGFYGPEGEYARRVLWTKLIGPIHHTKVLQSRCENKACISTDHMIYQNRSFMGRRWVAIQRGTTLPEWEGRGCDHDQCKSAGCAECV